MAETGTGETRTQSVTTARPAGIDLGTLAGVKFACPVYGALIGFAARVLLAERAEVPTLSAARS